MRALPFVLVVVVVLVVIGLGGCSSGHAGATDDGFDLGSFIANPYPRNQHPGAYAEPYGSQVPKQTYQLPPGPPPGNAIGWVRPYDHIPFGHLQKVREVKNCPPESSYARVGSGVFCVYPENQWFAECVNNQWLATRYRNRRVWVVHALVPDEESGKTWLETYPQDRPDASRCRIQLKGTPS